jgi:hypothetical protein
MRTRYWLPGWAPMIGITILGRVLAQRGIGPLDLAHEAVHVEQQRVDGWRFYVRYVLSRGWRVRYEAPAYAVQARAGCPVEGERGLAAQLAGPLYLWPCSRAEAAQAIRSFL